MERAEVHWMLVGGGAGGKQVLMGPYGVEAETVLYAEVKTEEWPARGMGGKGFGRCDVLGRANLHFQEDAKRTASPSPALPLNRRKRHGTAAVQKLRQ